MKILLLAGANCIHTARWANGLVARGIEVHLVSAHKNMHELDARVNLHILKNKAPLGYFAAVFAVRKLINKIQPGLVNAHYATGYGLLARLVGFKPTLLSVWGSDVYDFPEKSFLHRWLLKGNLKSATAIASTSHCMARKTAETFLHKKVFITPFGIDETIFSPSNKPESLQDQIVLGTVKTLKSKYGIDVLIQAFAQAWKTLGSPANLKLEISGGGPDLALLQNLAQDLGVLKQVLFHGQVHHQDVPKMLNRLDIYCAFSRLDSESFGVAILEASSCEKPVIVSDADGPAEVTLDCVTGLVVPKEDIDASAKAMIKLIQDKTLRKKMGQAGRKHVLEHYTWDKSVDLMIEAYKETVSNV
ncbi:MAG: glycosyltransferase [Methyloprofundus sp.]|nr:glycosyltransferase [Methyloprofundus sp.]